MEKSRTCHLAHFLHILNLCFLLLYIPRTDLPNLHHNLFTFLLLKSYCIVIYTLSNEVFTRGNYLKNLCTIRAFHSVLLPPWVACSCYRVVTTAVHTSGRMGGVKFAVLYLLRVFLALKMLILGSVRNLSVVDFGHYS